MHKISETKKIYHSNLLAPTLIRLSLPARRLLYLCLEQIDRKFATGDLILTWEKNREFEIALQSYQNICGITKQSSFEQMVKGADELAKTNFVVDEAVFNPNIIDSAKRRFNVVSSAIYVKGQGKIIIRFTPEMLILTTSLKSNFTGQLLLRSVKIGINNAAKLYLLLNEWICVGKKEYCLISFDMLRRRLDLDFSYTKYGYFKTRFFKGAANYLIKQTEFVEIDIEIVSRYQRKADTVKVTYRYECKPEIKGIEEKNFTEERENDCPSGD